MACTTILVGKNASYDGSTMIARNDDSGSGHFTPKKFVVVDPKDQPHKYKSVISHVEVELPDSPMRCTAMPNAVDGEGIWAASGVNEAHVAMTATETITSNPRVLGADPLVCYQPAEDGKEEQAGGIGEEDIVCLVLPYIHSAREGVKRLGALLEQYGTYEMNGIAFQDVDEIWWLETIGGHHWIARRVPDDAYVVMPNQLGIDRFDLEDALSEQTEYMCSADLCEFIEKYHLDLSQEGGLNPRDAFGSHDDADHVYNTPRAWFMLRYLNPHSRVWDGENAEYTPYSDDLPWCMVPEKKVTVEDVKYVLSSHYQGTPYDPYLAYGDKSMSGAFRSIGINRNDFLSVIQMRPEGKPDSSIIEWVAFASNAFNVLVPFYADVDTTPEYLSNTTGEVSTDNFYWSSRMIAAMADASYKNSVFHIERYKEHVLAKGHELIHRFDALLEKETDSQKRMAIRREANEEIAKMVKKETSATLDKVLFELSSQMKNSYSRSDA
ncbi:C69 family dipeptidase [Roseburia sp. MUC/MUC-530-WT-4D]|uniref:Dipeptidase n=1 Tax=Roseburia porci TaxID=2605790 RepID=A0A6L5YU93_9FIRM|nr:C69 family dipeptidase [Roseburia porci]MST75945.1 C69 family dipeptidase [Roseburia porci]